MGFQEILSGGSFTTTFQSTNVYRIQGVILDDSIVDSVDAGDGVRFCYGNDLDELCQHLIGDDFFNNADEKRQWIEQKKSAPPYLMVHTQMKESVTATKGWWKNDADGLVITHEAFTDARKSLARYERKKVTPLIIRLSASLSDIKRSVSILHLQKVVDSITDEGKRLVDLSSKFSAELSTAVKYEREKMLEVSIEAVSASEPIPDTVAHWLNMAVNEADKYKKFTFFFLALEVYIAKTYSSLSYSLPDPSAPPHAPHIQASITRCWDRVKDKPASLFFRFLVCVSVKWLHLDDGDVDQVDGFTKLRNSMLHGSVTEDQSYPCHEVQTLVLKVLR